MYFFVDRIMSAGFAAAALGTALAVAVLLLAFAFYENPSAPQVVRLVALVPSPGSVILDDVGDSAALTAQGYYSDQTMEPLDADYITYESTDPAVVSVSTDGVVTATGAGGADVIVRYGGFNKPVHALVFGDIPTLPPIEPDMVGPIPGLAEEVRAVLNRVIVEMASGSGQAEAEDIASELGGEVIFSYSIFPGHVIDFDTQQQTLADALTQLGGDSRVETAYPDVLFEALGHPIDTLSLSGNGNAAYVNAGFEGAWRMMENIDVMDPVVISVVECGNLNLTAANQHQVIADEFDTNRIITFNPSPTGSHAAAVTSVIAAVNHGQDPGRNDPPGNFSGIVTSVENLKYHILAMDFESSFLGMRICPVSRMLARFQNLIEPNKSLIDVVNFSFVVATNRTGLSNVIPNMPKVVFVPGAGNCQRDARGYFPAALSLRLTNVITVGGANSDYTGRWTSQNLECNRGTGNSSAFGNAVSIAAPSEQVSVVNINDMTGYSLGNGTSYAAPMVTGTIALLRAIDPNLTPKEIKDLLVETGDTKIICTTTVVDTCVSDDQQKIIEDLETLSGGPFLSTYDELRNSLSADQEIWPFLRADKAVAQLLSDKIEAEIADRGTVPPASQRVVGSPFEFGVEIENTGEIAWPFHVEAQVRSPSGSERILGFKIGDSKEENTVAIAPGESHPVRWGFWANEAGCWDIKVRVWLDDPFDRESHLREALRELNPNMASMDIGLLAESGWREEVLEVRSEPGQAEQCSGTDQMIPKVIDDEVRAGGKANILLLADTSGSMGGPKLEALKEAIEVFIDQMSDIRFQAKGGVDPDPDHVGLVNFDDSFSEELPIGPIDPSTGLETWDRAVASLDANGGTALYDAIIQAVDELEERNELDRANVLIALTDGMDEDSRNSLSDAIERLEGASVTLFALALSEPGGTGGYDFSVLEQMANATEGSAYTADTENLSELYELFSTIFEIGR